MKVAVMSDIHGFSLAFKSVLEDIDRQGLFDQIAIAGDLCELGPAPREVLEIIWARDFAVAQGNTDRELVHAAGDRNAGPELRYAIDRIGRDGLDYLASLPFSHRISPPDAGGLKDDLLVVHANPSNMDDPLPPDLDEAGVRDLVGNTMVAAIAFGHFHVSYIRQVDGLLLVDVSAVGNSKDGDLRCKYGILTWNDADRRWSAELRKLDYPLEATEAQIRQSGLPKPEKVIRKLRQASYRKD
jgi:predicted phosphodiesterase